MEGSPDEEDGRLSTPVRRTHGPERPRAEPNLWILVGITALSLAIAVAVLVLTAIGP